MNITQIGHSSSQILSFDTRDETEPDIQFLFSFGSPVAALLEGKLYKLKTASSFQNKHIRAFIANTLEPYMDSVSIPKVLVCKSWFKIALRSVLYNEPVPPITT